MLFPPLSSSIINIPEIPKDNFTFWQNYEIVVVPGYGEKGRKSYYFNYIKPSWINVSKMKLLVSRNACLTSVEWSIVVKEGKFYEKLRINRKNLKICFLVLPLKYFMYLLYLPQSLAANLTGVCHINRIESVYLPPPKYNIKFTGIQCRLFFHPSASLRDPDGWDSFWHEANMQNYLSTISSLVLFHKIAGRMSRYLASGSTEVSADLSNGNPAR